MSRVAVVTGATSGIGRAAVELLLKEKVHVVGLARDQEKAQAVKASLEALLDDVRLDFVIGDLKNNATATQSGQDLRAFIDATYQGQLDIIMHVAGTVTSGYQENEDGNEMTFAINHLSVFILTYHLLPLISVSKDPRMMVVSSLSHYRASLNWNNIQNKKLYNILKAYKRSKLYNVFFVKAFAHKYPNIPTLAIDPGLVNTDLGLKNTSKLVQWIWKTRRNRGTDIYYPASFMVDVALKPAYKTLSGHYIKEGKSVKSNPITYHLDDALRLWDYTASLTNNHY